MAAKVLSWRSGLGAGIASAALLAGLVACGHSDTPQAQGTKKAAASCKAVLPFVERDDAAPEAGATRAAQAEPLALEASRLDAQWNDLHAALVTYGRQLQDIKKDQDTLTSTLPSAVGPAFHAYIDSALATNAQRVREQCRRATVGSKDQDLFSP